MPVDLKAAGRLVPVIDNALSQVPPYRDLTRRADAPLRAAALDRLRQSIRTAGGTFTEGPFVAAVRLAGLRASSAHGLAGACRNWISLVAVRTARERMTAGDGTGAWVPQ